MTEHDDERFSHDAAAAAAGDVGRERRGEEEKRKCTHQRKQEGEQDAQGRQVDRRADRLASHDSMTAEAVTQ